MKPTHDQELLAAFFTALGHRRRQMLCEILAKVGSDGINYGDLQIKSGLTRATLSHHLNFMDKGGIIKRRIKGRETWYALNMPALSIWSGRFFQCISTNRQMATAP